MYGIIDYQIFMIAVVLLNITPGPDMIYILNNSLKDGLKSGIVATLGVNTGCLFHIFLAVVGLSVLLQTSVYAFTIVKYLGAVYLIYLGITTLLQKEKISTKEVKTSKSMKKTYLNGILINVLNPKIALFFITFLPLFIDVNAKEQSVGFIILGLTVIVFGTIISIVLSAIAIRIKNQFTYTQLLKKVINKLIGIVFIGFGIKLATSN